MAQRVSLLSLENPLGRFILAATGQGLCRVHRIAEGAEEEETRLRVLKDLEHRFGEVEIIPETADLDPAARYLESFSRDPRAAGRYGGRLDPGGTAFQRRVWDLLIEIPAGKTRGYGELAALAGSPGGARAAGAACGANPLIIVIPCHRAIGADRSLTGFGGGLELKRRLLAAEGALPAETQPSLSPLFENPGA
ncbi:methylated-DNA--[protein]-cysteine S-methyltransferase [bacterium]|nr:methylated-DNA--[protein]-cysteine S-methyltransferase [bacterium]